MTLASLGANEREILSARQSQNQAIAAFDADRVAGFWTDDVELRRGLGQLVLGRAAYRQLFVESGNRDSALVYQREPSHIESSPTWPLAFESGTWEAHVGRIDGPVVIRGQYGAQWVKRDGRWLIRSLIARFVMHFRHGSQLFSFLVRAGVVRKLSTNQVTNRQSLCLIDLN